MRRGQVSLADKSLKRPGREPRNRRKGPSPFRISLHMQTLLNVSNGLHFYRKFDNELGSTGFPVLHPDRSVMVAYDRADNRKAQPGALLFC
jgi:hypothetical protein